MKAHSEKKLILYSIKDYYAHIVKYYILLNSINKLLFIKYNYDE